MSTNLIKACIKGNLQRVETVLTKGRGANLELFDERGMNALHHAAEAGQSKILKVLLELPYCPVNRLVRSPNHSRSSALHYAAIKGHVECVQVLVEYGADVLHRNINGDTPLHLAKRLGFIGCVRVMGEGLFSTPKTPTLRFSSYYAPPSFDPVSSSNLLPSEKPQWDLMQGIVDGDLSRVASALSAGATVTDQHMIASVWSQGIATKLLFDHGGNPNMRNQFGVPLLHLACRWNAETSVRALIESGADVNALDPREADPLVWSVSPSITRMLIAAKANVNGPRAHESLLKLAIHRDQPEAVKLLLDAGADPRADCIGFLALTDALKSGNEAIIGAVVLADRKIHGAEPAPPVDSGRNGFGTVRAVFDCEEHPQLTMQCRRGDLFALEGDDVVWSNCTWNRGQSSGPLLWEAVVPFSANRPNDEASQKLSEIFAQRTLFKGKREAKLLSLLEEGVIHVNTVTAQFQTALHLACLRGIELIPTLLAFNARVDVRDILGNTPAHLLVQQANCLDSLKLLVEAGFDSFNDYNDKGNSLLSLAVSPDVKEYLFVMGAKEAILTDELRSQRDEWTAFQDNEARLADAVKNSDTEAARAILSVAPAIQAPLLANTEYDGSPLILLSAKLGSHSMFELLRSFGANDSIVRGFRKKPEPKPEGPTLTERVRGSLSRLSKSYATEDVAETATETQIVEEILAPLEDPLTLEACLEMMQDVAHFRVKPFLSPERRPDECFAQCNLLNEQVREQNSSDAVLRKFALLDEQECLVGGGGLEAIQARNAMRAECLEMVQKQLFEALHKSKEYQQKQCQLLRDAGAEQHSVSRVADLQKISDSKALVEELAGRVLTERLKSDALLQDLLTQFSAEKMAHAELHNAVEKVPQSFIPELNNQFRIASAMLEETERQIDFFQLKHAALKRQVEHAEKASEIAAELKRTTKPLKRALLELGEAERLLKHIEENGDDPEDASEKILIQSRVATATEAVKKCRAEHQTYALEAAAIGKDFPEVMEALKGSSSVGGWLHSLSSLCLMDFELGEYLRAPDVQLAKRRKDGSSCVLKRRQIENDRHQRLRLEKEVSILSKINHPLIIKLEDVFLEDNTAYLVLPYYEQGTLDDWLKASKRTSAQIQAVFLGIFQAVAFLHTSNFLHRDIKPSNILMKNNQPVLCDFDVANDQSAIKVTSSTFLNPGTFQFMAPELLNATTESVCSAASDMWSVGACLFRSYFTEAPLYLDSGQSCVNVPANNVAHLTDLLQSLLVREPQERLSADEALAHPFFISSSASDDTHMDHKLEAFREYCRLLKTEKGSGWALRYRIGSDVVADATELFLSIENNPLRPLRIVFEGERGIDGGALSTALFRRFFEAAQDPQEYLFVQHDSTMLPAAEYPPNLSQTEQLRRLRALGIATSIAVVTERIINLPLSVAMFKYLYGIEPNFGDLESFDSKAAENLRKLLRRPGAEDAMLSFDYCGGDEDVDVTDDNKLEFVKRMATWRLRDQISEQLAAFAGGFWSSPAAVMMRALHFRDLTVLMSGRDCMRPEMLTGTFLFQAFAADSVVPQALIQVVQRMNADDLRRFLLFCTEMSNVPIGGLKNPRGGQDDDKIIIQCARRAPTTALPTARVCFFTLMLPQYESEQILEEKLLIAIREQDSSFALW